MVFTAKCKRCGYYNNVAIKTDWLTDKPRCQRCGWILTPSQEAEIKPPRFDLPDVVLCIGGLVLGPAGLFAGLFMSLNRDNLYLKAKAKIAVAWAFIGCIIYLILFMFVPPMRQVIIQLYEKVIALRGGTG